MSNSKNPMKGYYEVSKSAAGSYHFTLHAGNHEIILTSEAYEDKAGAEQGIDSVRRNGHLDSRFQRKLSTLGEPYFVLKAQNGEIIGTGETYGSEAARDNGIQSVITNSPSIIVKDLCEA